MPLWILTLIVFGLHGLICSDISAVNDCIPRRTVKRTSNAPWISGDLIKLCRREKVLYKRAKKKTCALSDWNKYHKFNNYVKKECNSARRQFVNNLADELKTGNSSKPDIV